MKYGISVSEGCIASPGGLIYYKLARTSAPGRRPLIIFFLYIGCTHARGAKYARPLGEYGCHLLTFDFLGGGAHCRGGVLTTEMTVLTELRDLEAVLDAARAWDFADPERIYLMGASQGGFVSAACAARASSIHAPSAPTRAPSAVAKMALSRMTTPNARHTMPTPRNRFIPLLLPSRAP